MAKRAVVFEAADRLAKADVYVTDRALLDEVGGSFSDIGPLLNEWKGKRGYDSKLSRAGVPAKLQDAFAKLAGAICNDIRAETKSDFQESMSILEVKIQEAEAEIVRLRGDLELSRKALNAQILENDKLRKECNEAKSLAQRYRSEEFWDRVMRNIEAVLPDVGTMSGEDVLAALPLDLRKECISHREKWDPATLEKKMKVRSEHDKYFIMHAKGHFGRR